MSSKIFNYEVPPLFWESQGASPEQPIDALIHHAQKNFCSEIFVSNFSIEHLHSEIGFAIFFNSHKKTLCMEISGAWSARRVFYMAFDVTRFLQFMIL
jgi:hypothetical protein